MLQELDIEGYAVVDKLRVRFHAGLNLLTGETGSGKSIVVDSLALLFGARAGAAKKLKLCCPCAARLYLHDRLDVLQTA